MYQQIIYVIYLNQSKIVLFLKVKNINDISPIWYRAKKLLIRILPIKVVTLLAKFKEKIVYLKRT